MQVAVRKQTEEDSVSLDEVVPSQFGGDQDSEDPDASAESGLFDTRQKVGFPLGPALFALVLLLPTPAGLTFEAKAVAATTVWVATWWITEAIPIPATSLLPIVLFTATGAMDMKTATSGYSNPLIFVFLGGFIIALSLERWSLHRRIALGIIRAVGSSPDRITLGFMIATAFLSAWISNTATAMMMVPIGLAVILQVAKLIQENGVTGIDVRTGKFNFGSGLMLGIAYSASLGGIATLIGTPPNIVMAGVIRELFGQEIGFAQWMLVGVPLAVIGVLGVWYYLTRVAYPLKLQEIPGGMKVICDELRKMGPMSKQEKSVLAIFALVALGWITRPWIINPVLPNVDDATIAIFGATLLFVVPLSIKKGQFLLDWETAVRLPWGIVLLFGGGLSIAAGFKATGLATWIGEQLAVFSDMNLLLVITGIAGLTIFLTEVTSNTATTSMMMPVMASMATAMAVHPYTLMVAAAVAASCAFMLPVATPPNAIVFGSGYVTMPQMARTGLLLNILGVVVVTVVVYLWMPVIWGISLAP